jgi:hypothetical protein
MQPCGLNDLSGWLESEVLSIPVESHRRVLLEVNGNLSDFVKWPERAELLWQGCDRTVDYHKFPDTLKRLFKERKFAGDARSNGPAIAAFRVAGGCRPTRASGKGWHIHHTYDGKFPYPDGEEASLRARDTGHHFTQSARLVAVHPVADALADEIAIFAWRLRAESFVHFGYDPQGAFSGKPDEYGFSDRKCERVWHHG